VRQNKLVKIHSL